MKNSQILNILAISLYIYMSNNINNGFLKAKPFFTVAVIAFNCMLVRVLLLKQRKSVQKWGYFVACWIYAAFPSKMIENYVIHGNPIQNMHKFTQKSFQTIIIAIIIEKLSYKFMKRVLGNNWIRNSIFLLKSQYRKVSLINVSVYIVKTNQLLGEHPLTASFSKYKNLIFWIVMLGISKDFLLILIKPFTTNGKISFKTLPKIAILYTCLAGMLIAGSWLFPILGFYDKLMHENQLDRLIDMRFTHSYHSLIDMLITIFLLNILKDISNEIAKQLDKNHK